MNNPSTTVVARTSVVPIQPLKRSSVVVTTSVVLIQPLKRLLQRTSGTTPSIPRPSANVHRHSPALSNAEGSFVRRPSSITILDP